MKLGTHVPDGERRKPIDNEICRINFFALNFDNINKNQNQ
jgi:hypothetical protein